MSDKKECVAKLLGKDVVLPDYYTEVEELPYNPYGSPDALGYGTKSNNALCFITLTPTPLENAMPYNDQPGLVQICRQMIGEDQGIIEVQGGTTEAGRAYVYTIIKTRFVHDESPTPVISYTLNMDVDFQDFTLSIVGSFEEAFETGVRHAVGTGIIAKNMEGGFSFDKCFCDPYDPEVKSGFLMHLTESQAFDKLFPSHPLSIARELVAFIAERN